VLYFTLKRSATIASTPYNLPLKIMLTLKHVHMTILDPIQRKE
jgi:hypothetical protein